MRLLPLLVTALASSLLLACRDTTEPEPERPNPDRPGLTAARTTGPVICERMWYQSRDGSWNDSTNWFPRGVPSITDEVCFGVGGSYTVTIDSASFADSLYIAPGDSVTLHLTESNPNHTDLTVDEEIVVSASALLTLSGGQASAGDAIVEGDVHLDNTRLEVELLENRGILEMTDATLVAVTVDTDSDVRLNGAETWYVDSAVNFTGGRTTGNGTLKVQSFEDDARFRWSAGVFPGRSGGSPAVFSIQDLSLELLSTSLSGAIDLVEGSRVYGDIGTSVDLQLVPEPLSPWQPIYWLALLPPVGAPPTTPVVVNGRLRFPDALTQLSSSTRVVLQVPVSGSFDIEIPELDNQATLDLGSYSSFGTDPTHVLRNSGVIRVDTHLSLHSGALIAEPGSRVHGTVFAQPGSFVRGSGTMSGLWLQGSLEPGPGLATFTVDTLVGYPGSRLELEVASLSSFDRVDVREVAYLESTLKVSSLGTFVGGLCGQRLPVLTSRNSASGTAMGNIPSVGGLPAGVPRGWRAQLGSDTVFVTGYDPTRIIGLDVGGGTLTEGSPGQVVHVCLGAPVTTSPVTATLFGVRGQLAASPNPLSFKATDWAMPQRLTLAAIDDAASEGPHGDTLTFALASADRAFSVPTPRIPFGIADNDPGVDLAITMVSTNPTHTVNQVFERRIRITNNGPGASTGSDVNIPNLAGAAYRSAFGATCAMNGANLQCAVGALASGAFVEFTIVFQASATAGTFNNTFRVRGRDWDNVAANDTLSWSLTIS